MCEKHQQDASTEVENPAPEAAATATVRMMDEEKCCIDILTQVTALNTALEAVAFGLLDDHLTHCVMDAAAEGGSVAGARLKDARRHRPPGPLLTRTTSPTQP